MHTDNVCHRLFSAAAALLSSSGSSSGSMDSGGSGGSGGNGGVKKNKYVSQHSLKMAGFANPLCGDSVDQAIVSTRAEHHSGNYNTYGTRGITCVPDSGGPPAIHDIIMAKLLADLDQ